MGEHAAVTSEQLPPITAMNAPRAEFRVFGQGLIEQLQPRMYNGRTVLLQARRMPPEVYLLSVAGEDANVKLRAGLLDIKLKVGETAEGYEIFEPRAKFELPIAQADLATTFEWLGARPPLTQQRYDSAQLLALARADAALRLVTVEKMRHGFSIDGIVCEFAQVWFNGALIETACVESTDLASMRRVIAELGLAELPNTSYLRAAKRVVGLLD